MSWFRREAPRTVDDPVFGTLNLNRRIGWEAQVAAPTPSEKLVVAISRFADAPNDDDRRVFADFVANYSHLVPALSLELFKLLEPSLRIPEWDEVGAKIN
jgi:hypothetical protein